MKSEIRKPPRFAERILTKVFSRSGDASAGDFEEVYLEIAERRGRFAAGWWYRVQMLSSVYSFFIGILYWSGAMFKNYLKVAVRNLKRRKVFSLINIAGLAIGIGVCVLIFLYVAYELGFDSHVADREYVYRVCTHIARNDGSVERNGCTPFPTAEAMRNDFPELERTAQVFHADDAMIGVGEERFKKNRLFFVEPVLFEVFNIEWVLGDAGTALEDPEAVLLTERMALKYFGSTDILGRTLRLDNELDLHVTGILADPPRRTSLPYDMLISWATMDAYLGDDLTKWDGIWSSSHTYVRLPGAVSPGDLQERFEAFEEKYMTPEHADTWSFHLQPLSDIHFNRQYGSYSYVTSRAVLVVFSALGFLILLIACINFINLTTAQAMTRAREMGMRKVLGADRSRLIRQLLGETSLVTFLAILIALLFAWGALPSLNRFLGRQTELEFVLGNGLLVFLGGMYLFVTALNGLYPALVLSRYRPADALKDRAASHGKRTSTLRNALVLFQFIISQVLIVGTLVIAGQTTFMARMELGFRKEGMLTVPLPEYEESRCEALRGRWMENPRISNVGFAWSAPVSDSNFSTPLIFEASGDLTEWPVSIKMCDNRYLDIYEIPLVAGRFFQQTAGDESNKQWVVTETVVRKMGLSDPWDAVGRTVNVNGFDGPIIGVIGDFHAGSLRTEIKPTVFFNFWPQNNREAQIQMDLEDARYTVDYIRDVWTEYYPEYLFEYRFLDDFVNGLYETEAKLLTMIRWASFLAILLACLGLLGLAAFMVVRRTKEIGIRKVLGASVGNLYLILSRDFLKWVAAASLLAWPAAYVLTSEWLQEFAYRIRLAAGYFLLGGVISFGIAVLVVTVQVRRAAGANPVESIKYE